VSGPELFVVCKSCGAEVSPYITECPYCGKRLRKRAPSLDKPPKPPRRLRAGSGAKAAPRPRRERTYYDEVRGTRPYVSIALVLASLIVVVGFKSGLWSYGSLVAGDFRLFTDPSDEPWRYLTTLFVYGSTGYEVVALAALFLFSWLLERRFGWFVPLLVFVLAGGLGVFTAITLEDVAVVVGANGAALGMLTAWTLAVVRDGDEDHDRLGLIAAAAVLAALPLAVSEADAVAGIVGAAIGAVIGLAVGRARGTH
jgi:membrane associated rhomboid family serine protease